MATVLCKLWQSGTDTSCLGVKTHVYPLAHTCTNTCHTSVCVYVCGVVCVCVFVCVCVCVCPPSRTHFIFLRVSKQGRNPAAILQKALSGPGSSNIRLTTDARRSGGHASNLVSMSRDLAGFQEAIPFKSDSSSTQLLGPRRPRKN